MHAEKFAAKYWIVINFPMRGVLNRTNFTCTTRERSSQGKTEAGKIFSPGLSSAFSKAVAAELSHRSSRKCLPELIALDCTYARARVFALNRLDYN